MAFKKDLNGLIQYSKNYCNTNIVSIYNGESYSTLIGHILTTSRHEDVTPDILILTKAVYKICEAIKTELQTEDITKTMLSGVKHIMVPFPYCFTIPIRMNLNLSVKTTPSINKVDIKANRHGVLLKHDEIVVSARAISHAILFFIKTCFLAHKLYDLAKTHQNALTQYAMSMLAVMELVIKHIPKFDDSMLYPTDSPQSYRLYMEVFMVFVEMTFAIHTLIVSFMEVLKSNTYHDQTVMIKNMKKCKKNLPMQTLYLTRANETLNRYSHRYDNY
nr:ORF37 [Acipenserid herpesvirus 1]